VVGQGNADIADTLPLRDVAMATIFVFLCMGCTWRHLVNTTEPSVCGDDAALSNYFDNLLGLIMHQQRLAAGFPGLPSSLDIAIFVLKRDVKLQPTLD